MNNDNKNFIGKESSQKQMQEHILRTDDLSKSHVTPIEAHSQGKIIEPY